MQTYPLLQSQMGVFLEWSQHPEKMVYNIPILLTFPSFVTAIQLKEAFIKVLEHHPSLFVKLYKESNQVVQRLVLDGSIEIEIRNISESSLEKEKKILCIHFNCLMNDFGELES